MNFIDYDRERGRMLAQDVLRNEAELAPRSPARKRYKYQNERPAKSWNHSNQPMKLFLCDSVKRRLRELNEQKV